MFGDDRYRLERDGIRVKTPEKQVIGLELGPRRRSLAIAKVRCQPRKTWVTYDAPIELPRKIELGCQEIIEKAATWSHAIALLDLYSISRAEFEHPTTSS
jgi:hypothetical protein